jgi:indole-3-glycerol phosphate synthase
MTNDLLPALVASARRSAEARRQVTPAAELDRRMAEYEPLADVFRESLRTPGIRIIAECKRRSPSRGILRRDYDPAAIAQAYEAAGAAAISVLTEASFFDGSLDHLRQVRAVTGLPLLRKDFIVTDFQLQEARAAGADAALLIVAALDDQSLRHLIDTARALGLVALVEIHDREELMRALQAGATVIGVNSRNLHTLQVQLAVFEEVILGIPNEAIAVAESGLRTAEHLRQLRASGYDAFLIGERFMIESRPGDALSDLRAAASAELEEFR